MAPRSPLAYPPHPTRCTLHPAPCTLHPAPCTLHPAPCTMHPAPCTLHLAPCTLHPATCTLHPTPHTLHPSPYYPEPTPSNKFRSTINPESYPPTPQVIASAKVSVLECNCMTLKYSAPRMGGNKVPFSLQPGIPPLRLTVAAALT